MLTGALEVIGSVGKESCRCLLTFTLPFYLFRFSFYLLVMLFSDPSRAAGPAREVLG